jgi:hypothetical protein
VLPEEEAVDEEAESDAEEADMTALLMRGSGAAAGSAQCPAKSPAEQGLAEIAQNVLQQQFARLMIIGLNRISYWMF